MNEEFYAVIKLVSGEELFGIVSPTEEHGIEYLIVSDPVTITKLDLDAEYISYKIEPWLQLTTDSIFILEKSKIITLIESFDEALIILYKSYLYELDSFEGGYSLDRSEGYIDNVKNFRFTLEKLYRT